MDLYIRLKTRTKYYMFDFGSRSYANSKDSFCYYMTIRFTDDEPIRPYPDESTFKIGDKAHTTINALITVDAPFKIIADKDGVTWNGEVINPISGVTPFKGAYPLYIFQNNTGGNTAGGYTSTNYECYGFRVYDGEDLIFDGQPALNEEGLAGLWNKVTDEFLLPPIGEFLYLD